MSTTLIRRPQTLVPPAYIQLLCKTITDCVEQNVAGDVIEIGVYKGGSLYRMAEHAAAKHAQAFATRRIIGVDTFAGHPYHDPKLDPAHHFTGRFADTSYEAVREAMSGFEFVNVIQGECENAFATFADDQKFCLANVDVDVAESAMRCTRYLFSHLSVGGVMIYDEYQGYGQKSLLDEFFRDKPVRLIERGGLPSGNYGLIVQKLAA
jgi:O-methyltransferase